MSAPNEQLERTRAYGAGHPWYYVLGGPLLGPASIRRAVLERGYRGYLAQEIDAANNKSEPQRSEALRCLKQQALCDFRQSLLRYRQLARELRAFRMSGQTETECTDLHTAISFKHNHLFNDIAQLIVLDHCLSQQRDLFG